MSRKDTRKAPERHELEATGRQAIVLWPSLPTAGALRPISRMRVQINGECHVAELLLEPHVAVHKSPVLLNPIRDSLDLHPPVRFREVGVWRNPFSQSRRAGYITVASRTRVGSCPRHGWHRTPPTARLQTADGFHTSYTHHRMCSLFSGGPSGQERLFITVERSGVVIRVGVGAHNLLGAWGAMR